MERTYKTLAVYLFALLFTHTCFAEGLSTLIEVGKSQDGMEMQLNDETKTFDAVKEAIEKGAITKGLTQESILNNYGKPVVVLAEDGNREKWIYKPGWASHFEGVKIYLFFDPQKKLDGIKMLNR
ncbi:MAG: hypothetical protein ABID09_07780 [Candidatus Omnitrophota bacterium]